MYQIPQKYTSKKKEKCTSQVPSSRGSIYAAPLLEKLSSHTLPFNQTSKARGNGKLAQFGDILYGTPTSLTRLIEWQSV